MAMWATAQMKGNEMVQTLMVGIRPILMLAIVATVLGLTREGAAQYQPVGPPRIQPSTAPPDCRRPCLESGRCFHRPGRCVAALEAHCRASQSCRAYGLCALDQETESCVPQQERNSTGMMVSGIVVSGLGGLTALAGMLVGVTNICIMSCSSEDRRAQEIGNGLMVGGLVGAVAGVPLMIAGAVRVDVKPGHALAPDVALGPNSASLSWSF